MSTDDQADNAPGMFVDIFGLLWMRRWLILAGFLVGLLAGAGLGLVMPKMYRSEAVLEYVDRSGGTLPSGAGGLRDLAGLAGVTISQPSGRSYAIGRLKSADLLTQYVSASKAQASLFADQWDSKTNSFRQTPGKRTPTVQDSVNKFRKNIMSVDEDKLTQLITLRFRWTDARLAHKWASEFPAFVDSNLKQQAIVEADRNMSFLEREIQQAQLPEIRAGLARMVESEIGKKMNARSASAYAFRIVDPPSVQERPYSPNRPLLAAAGALVGALLMSVILIFAAALPVRRRS
jgi:uncharacterized protein involved in exopolysaccharide biosynthesis